MSHPNARRLPYTTERSSDHVDCLPLSIILYCLQTKVTHPTKAREKKIDTMTNNRGSNLDGSTVCGWCGVLVSEFDHPRRRYGKSTIRAELSKYELGRNRQIEVATNDTTQSQIIITPSYMRLTQPKPNLTSTSI